jgi:putative ABC transport system permease protein
VSGLGRHYLFDSYAGTDVLAGALRSERMLAVVSSSAGVLIVVLTGIGLYGFCAYVFSLRNRELAIRAALGATPRQVRLSALAETITVLIAGATLGLILTISARHLALWAGLDLAEPSAAALSFALFAMAVVTTGALAVPLMRTTRSDLATSLRGE